MAKKPTTPAAVPAPPAPRIAAASLSASGTFQAHRRDLAKAIEAAMSQAVLDALADGVSIDNSPEILRRKQRARGKVLEAHGLPLPADVVAAREP